MQHCLELAKNGLGTTYPNPPVGAVLVYKDTVIGEGWHRKAGEPHAEVLAIQSVKETKFLKESTLYVNLEPCSHFGKTPPCADLVIEKKIPRVVIGTLDPNPEVSGNGVKKLLNAGCKVGVGIMEKECEMVNKRFFTFHRHHRPYVILKWAQSADGFMAPEYKDSPQPFWISSSVSRQLVHKWRTEEQAILVGAQTVITDNPQLTARHWQGSQPLRVVIGGNTILPARASVFDQSAQTLFINTQPGLQTELPNWVDQTDSDTSRPLADEVADILFKKNIQSLIVEGGRKTLDTFLVSGIWDEARVFVSPIELKKGLMAPKLECCPDEVVHSDTDTLNLFYHAR